MELNPLTYALLAQDAYSAAPTIGEGSSDARVVVESTIDGTALTFPGTDNLACWLADLDCQKAMTPLGPVHCGFNDAALRVIRDVEALAAVTPGPIVTCGHSLGAALAVLVAGYLCKAGRPPAAVFAFEPPRMTCSPALGNVLRRNGVRLALYRNGNDVVPMVPRLLEDWRHPAPLTQIGVPHFPFPNVEDHEMGHVVEAIRALVGA